MTQITPAGPVLKDIQGLIIRGYTHPFSTHMIFQFGSNQTSLAGFIKSIYPYVQSAATWAIKPVHMLNIGLTATGIAKLNPGFNMSFYPSEFVAGPASPDSQGSLFDLGPSAPANWLFGNTTNPIDCIVHVYGISNNAVDELVSIVSAAATTAGNTEIFPISGGKRLEQFSKLGNKYIHFGYHDGIDNPDLSTSLVPVQGQSYTDPQNLNNFLIGYGNSNLSAIGPGPTGSGPECAFAANGCYDAFRMLGQDLQGFETFLENTSKQITSQVPPEVKDPKEWLAAKLVGRWRNGCPLELAPFEPSQECASCTDFDYPVVNPSTAPPDGLKCPVSAHSRVANPRNSPMTGANTPVSRILRRGVPYGENLGADYNNESGLIGLFLCGSLAGQFERISGWMNINNFTNYLAGQYPNTQDALLAYRPTPPATSPIVSGTVQTFEIPVSDTNGNVVNITPEPVLPQFIITIGSAYCLFPSLSALRSCYE
jgi:deferrochelatase/peroxidase EfeB